MSLCGSFQTTRSLSLLLLFEDCLLGFCSAPAPLSLSGPPFLYPPTDPPPKTKDGLAARPTHRQAESILKKAPS